METCKSITIYHYIIRTSITNLQDRSKHHKFVKFVKQFLNEKNLH